MDGHQANGAFVACGPPGFTALALINLADRGRDMYVALIVYGNVIANALWYVRLKARQLVSDLAGEIWYASSVMSALLLFGLAVFFFIFGALPYWFKLHKHLDEILGCEYRDIRTSLRSLKFFFCCQAGP